MNIVILRRETKVIHGNPTHYEEQHFDGVNTFMGAAALSTNPTIERRTYKIRRLVKITRGVLENFYYVVADSLVNEVWDNLEKEKNGWYESYTKKRDSITAATFWDRLRYLFTKNLEVRGQS